MGIKTIPLSDLEADPLGMLTECADAGEAVVIELPDHRLIAMHSLEPSADDALVNELLESNAAFREVVARSKASARKTFGAI